MKKLIPFLILFFAISAWAGFVQQKKKIIMSQSVAVSTCPDYYATAVLSWDGDHGDGVLNACDSAGNAVLLTDDGSADIGATGEGGSNAMTCNDAGETISGTQTAGQYFDATADQTLCIKVWIDDTFDSHRAIMKFRDVETDDQVYIDCRNNGIMTGQWFTEGNNDSCVGTTPPYDAWIVMAYSFEGTAIPTNAKNSSNPGDQTPWINAWEDDDADDLDDLVDNPTIIVIGASGDPGDVEYIIIDEWAIFPGYKVNCSDYF